MEVDPLKLRARLAVAGMLALGLGALVWRSNANRMSSPVEGAVQQARPQQDPEEVGTGRPNTPQLTSPAPERLKIPTPPPTSEVTRPMTDLDDPKPKVETATTGNPETPQDTGPDGGVDPELALTPETLSELADAMHPEIEDCVNAWSDALPEELQGRLVLAFTLDEQGVAEAWVEDVEALPAGMLGCFSSAVYSQRWPAAEGGVEVTLPFEVDMGDGGVPQDPGGELIDRREEAD